MPNQTDAANELRRAYDSLMELEVGANTSTHQILDELRALYIRAFQVYTRGDLQNAELLARALTCLARAAWRDAKIKHLESHSEDLPHVVGLGDERKNRMDEMIVEIEGLLGRLKLRGLADRFAGRARKHLSYFLSLDDRRTLLAESFLKAAYEYCVAAELLHRVEDDVVAA